MNKIDEASDEFLRTAASKMVDEIEKQRKAGKYSNDRRSELETIFFNNMMKMIQGEIKPESENINKIQKLVRSINNIQEEKIPNNQKEALKCFADANGRRWKSKLNQAWMTGNYSDAPDDCDTSALQQFRNQFGPTRLANLKLKNL